MDAKSTKTFSELMDAEILPRNAQERFGVIVGDLAARNIAYMDPIRALVDKYTPEVDRVLRGEVITAVESRITRYLINPGDSSGGDALAHMNQSTPRGDPALTETQYDKLTVGAHAVAGHLLKAAGYDLAANANFAQAGAVLMRTELSDIL
jgi:hypothetical protein